MAQFTQHALKLASANALLKFVDEHPLVHWKLYSGNATNNTQALAQTPDIDNYTKAESIKLLQEMLGCFGNGSGKLRLVQNHKQRAANGVLLEFNMMPMQSRFGPTYGIFSQQNNAATIGSVQQAPAYNNAIIGRLDALQDKLHSKDLELERLRREFEQKEAARQHQELKEEIQYLRDDLEGKSATILSTIFNALNNESIAPAITGLFDVLVAKIAGVPLQHPAINGIGNQSGVVRKVGGDYQEPTTQQQNNIQNQNTTKTPMTQQEQVQAEQKKVGQALNELQALLPEYTVSEVVQAMVSFLNQNSMMRPMVIEQLKKYLPNGSH
ncbi:MAG: hypothetical protein ACPG5B_06795 [Chitinophagales bacterium]